jgi:hypothetical protein
MTFYEHINVTNHGLRRMVYDARFVINRHISCSATVRGDGLYRESSFTQSQALGIEALCRVSCFAECLDLLRVALGIETLCQVVDKRHSAKRLALGNVPVSHSARVIGS